ncbi:hypothetical protein CLAFUW4_12566 [Fulvia fulva]|uniref:Uncharacterized protein n=1 Tax=Passalora fulva TaxID=5499 RepID=A0A9Q8PDZ7_PASFU|nr:uncharacterized protein CLAFUR5_11591 [Fulvia fulva]KAK4617625.1 hypothetical protein CLAFUR4_12571 [Fulvia fulva]KAK4619199.1 hypothetical protein CLAFUR0_12582 [Fulvia fulva]UJO20686.1 hypothetical protein CLAFUR5_11591 [Fulvia fulva]WPV18104.1 hypothetical protein CLAFUW4_12566 [Fulvia fulva]WPV33094.1 hypothetical protein CLAFUW7_12573 [Fulvia fulva]
MAPANAMRLCTEACKTDDVLRMEQAISVASQSGSRFTVQDVVQRGLRRAAARSAVQVLRYVIEQGVDIKKLVAKDIMINDEPLEPSVEVLEILVAHGWDVNSRGDSWPLLWYVVEYPDLVRWCLDHRAEVDIPDDPPQANADGTESRTKLPRPTILSLAASSSSIETFELLRAQGAPLDQRTLHLAVKTATSLAPKGGSTGHVRRLVPSLAGTFPSCKPCRTGEAENRKDDAYITVSQPFKMIDNTRVT